MAQGQATKVKKKKKSVLKRAAKSLQRAEVNRANRTRVRTLMRAIFSSPRCRQSTRPLPRTCCTRTPPTATSRASRWPTTASKRKPRSSEVLPLFGLVGFCRGGLRPARSFFSLRGLMSHAIPITRVSQSRLTEALRENSEFGATFSDHMLVADWEAGSWKQPQIVPFGPISFSPALTPFHYGQAIFEVFKAHRT